MKLVVVTTTINIPTFLEGYGADMREHGHREVQMIVVGDHKTPQGVSQYCQELQGKYGYPCEYYGVTEQEQYLQRYPELARYLPWNSVQRRNVGMVRAYELGAEIILTVDDDNYLLEPNLLKQHLTVGTLLRLESFGSASGWLDPCQFLQERRGIPFYHRGFPLEERWKEGAVEQGEREGRVVVNVGLWKGDPDTDAWARLSFPLEAVSYTQEENFTLAPGTFAPFNSQQTAIYRPVLPAYFLNPNAGRYDDIFASYIVHRIAHHLGDLVSYGRPIVRHEQKRSLPSLFHDLHDEHMGIQLVLPFTQALRGMMLRGKTYQECYGEIAKGLQSWVREVELPVVNGREYLAEYVGGMEMWRRTIGRAGHGVL